VQLEAVPDVEYVPAEHCLHVTGAYSNCITAAQLLKGISFRLKLQESPLDPHEMVITSPEDTVKSTSDK
jgi:hypothetical protein